MARARILTCPLCKDADAQLVRVGFETFLEYGCFDDNDQWECSDSAHGPIPADHELHFGLPADVAKLIHAVAGSRRQTINKRAKEAAQSRVYLNLIYCEGCRVWFDQTRLVLSVNG